MPSILFLLGAVFAVVLLFAASVSADAEREATLSTLEEDAKYPLNREVLSTKEEPESVVILGDIGSSVSVAAGDVVEVGRDSHAAATEGGASIKNLEEAVREEMGGAQMDNSAEQEAILEVMRLQESIAAEDLAEERAEAVSASALHAQDTEEASRGQDATESILHSTPRHAAMHEKRPNIVSGGPRVASHRVRFGESKSGLSKTTVAAHADEPHEGSRPRTSMKASFPSDSDVIGGGGGRGDFSKRIQEALEASAREEEEQKVRFHPFLRPSDSLDSGSEQDDNLDGSDEEGSMNYLDRRFKVARKFGRPVEVILDMAQRSDSSHYEILGLRPTASPSEVKQAYRLKSLEVHPDKNPHPDAKRAFDALVTSYEVLADEEERQRYDQRRAVVKAARNPFKFSNIKIAVVETLDNMVSRLLLFVARIRRGDWREETEEAWEVMRGLDLKRRYSNFFRHYSLLPTWSDRAALAGEQIWDQKYKLLSVLLSWVALRSILVSSPPASLVISDIPDFM